MNKEEICKHIKEAFEEGYDSFATSCSAYNTVEDAWKESEAKKVHDAFILRND